MISKTLVVELQQELVMLTPEQLQQLELPSNFLELWSMEEERRGAIIFFSQ